MPAPYVKLQAERGSTPKVVVPVFRPLPAGAPLDQAPEPETNLSLMELTFTMRRPPSYRDRRKVTKTKTDGISVVGHVATVQLTQTDLRLAETNRTTRLLWDLVAESGQDRVIVARGELDVLAVPSGFG